MAARGAMLYGDILDRGGWSIDGMPVWFYAHNRRIPIELFRKAKARAASRDESFKTLITRAVAAEVGQEAPGATRGRMTLPLFGNRKGRRVDLRAEDIAQALADDDAVRSVGRRRR